MNLRTRTPCNRPFQSGTATAGAGGFLWTCTLTWRSSPGESGTTDWSFPIIHTIKYNQYIKLNITKIYIVIITNSNDDDYYYLTKFFFILKLNNYKYINISL